MSEWWPQVRLREILQPVAREETVDSTKTYRLLGIRLGGRGPFLRETVSGTGTAATKLYRVETGDFIYSRLFAWRGAFGTITPAHDSCYVSAEFPTFRPIDGRLDVRFLCYWFQLPENLYGVEEKCVGSTPLTRNRFKEHFFLDLELRLPPLAEQRRIVARITELAAKVDDVLSLRIRSLQEMELLIERTRARVFEGAQARDEVSLDSIALLERGKFSHRPRNDARFFGGQHPWIQIAEIESSRKYIREYHETLNDEGLSVSRKFPKGTVLVSIAATIGAVGILDFDCCIPDSIVGVTPKDQTDSGFLYHYLSYARTHLERIAPRSAQKNVNLQILRPLPVPDYNPEEQVRVGQYMDNICECVEAAKDSQTSTGQEIAALLPSILDRAFKGEL